MIIMAANRSLRDIVKQKINFYCECPISKLKEHQICNKSPNCKPSTEAESLYLALRERIQVFHIEKPIFPQNRSK
jgi:hypothetical protein